MPDKRFRTNGDIAIEKTHTTVMSVKQSPIGDAVRIRIHHMFLAASPSVVSALAQWVKSPRNKKAGDVLDAFIRGHRDRIRRRHPRRITIVTAGEHFDLKLIFDRLNALYFEGQVEGPITWGRMPSVRRRYSIRFGSYYPQENLIRIHPLLDQKFVPRYFVEYIVFHEMLHAHLGIEDRGSARRQIHGAAFK